MSNTRGHRRLIVGLAAVAALACIAGGVAAWASLGPSGQGRMACDSEHSSSQESGGSAAHRDGSMTREETFRYWTKERAKSARPIINGTRGEAESPCLNE